MSDAMTTLKPHTALGGTVPRVSTFGDLRIEENTDLGLASLSLRHGQTPPTPFGMALPAPSETTKSGLYGAFWMGQGQWMITAEGQGDTDFAAMVKRETPGMTVTEQTDGVVVMDVLSKTGAAPIQQLMRKLVNIDPKVLEAGKATRTGLEHMTVFLVRHSDTHLAVIGMRSLAGSLWHALTVAADRLED